MARIGEEDPRWIVEDRADGKNVNAWHWEEKDAKRWAQNRLSELLSGIQLYSSETENYSITKVDNLSGECYYNQRKGKLIAFYELNITLKWVGKLENGEKATEANGEIKMPYVSEENDLDDFEIKFSVNDKNADRNKMCSTAQKYGEKIIREKVVQFLKELKEGKGAGATPTKSGSPSFTPVPVNLNQCTKFTMTYTLPSKLTPAQVFKHLTDEALLSQILSSPISIERKKNGAISLMNGELFGMIASIKHHNYQPPHYLSTIGHVEEVVDGSNRIKYRARMTEWNDGWMSSITISCTKGSDDSVIAALHHDEIPLEDKNGSKPIHRIEDFWNNKFWNKVHQHLAKL